MITFHEKERKSDINIEGHGSSVHHVLGLCPPPINLFKEATLNLGLVANKQILFFSGGGVPSSKCRTGGTPQKLSNILGFKVTQFTTL